jgi:isoleucyl-tRNA synthetase
VETYRKLRNTIRWMLGSLAHFREEDRIAPAQMPELERLMLHRLTELDRQVRQAYADFDYKRIFAALNVFMTATSRRSTSTSARTRSTAIRSLRRRARRP